LLALTVSLVLVGAVLAGWQISLLGRYWEGRGLPRRAVVVSAVIIYLILGILVLAGFNWVVLLSATACLACALLFQRTVRRRAGIGKISLAVGFALAASLIQFPYALNDHLSKRREAVEAVSVQAVARTDTWKMSVLEQALDWVSDDREVGDQLLGGRANLDAYALDLWANSILGKAHVLSGIYILGPDHLELGRFSLQDVGDVSDMEAILREARFVGRPMTSVMRGTSGGREVNLYVGVAPFFRGGSYLGSIVVTIPYASRDIAAIAAQAYSIFDAIGPEVASPGVPAGEYFASRISGGRIMSTTGRAFEVGRRVPGLERLDRPAWLEHEVGGGTHASYFVPYGDEQEALLLSFALPSIRDRAIRLMGITVGNILIAFLVIILAWLVKAMRMILRRVRGRPEGRLRWDFATKLAAAFVLIAIVPTLILGTASSRFLRSRLREIVESRAAESLNLSRLALDRHIFGEAIRLARNPILLDALEAEPSLLGQMVTQDLKFLGYEVSSAVIAAGGDTMATFGRPELPAEVLESVLNEGRSYNFYSADDHLVAKAAVPLRDEISPDKVTGCAFVSRRLDNGLARQISSDLGRDLNFYGNPVVAASSRQELYISELVPSLIASSAFIECFVNGRELHFTRERLGEVDLVIGYSPLRDAAGNPVGAMSVPVAYRQDDVGRGMEATSAAISYLLVIVIGAIFIFGLMLARRISSPIHDLIQGTLKIGSGDLSFTIPKSRDDEIGDLVTSFNKMTAALARSRKTLSERKRYIETIIGNVGAGIIATDSRGRIDTFNSAAEKLLGIKARHARGREVERVLRRIGASRLAAVLDEVRGDRGIARKEVVLSRKGGEQVTLRAAVTAVKGPRSRDMGRVMVFEDVTELIRSKKLVAWSEMARQVAHEIKNPLTPMKLSAQQVLQAHRDGAGDFGSVLEESVATIVEQIESLRRIAVEFSQFSRMPARELKKSSLNAILEDSIGQYERTIAGSVSFEKDLDGKLPDLMVDADEVKRVFLNVIENAVQAMPEGGTLKIESFKDRPRRRKSGYDAVATSSESLARSGGEFVEVSFTDSGSGISTENAGKLFEPNFSTKSHGTGLGLAICRGIMDAYGGALVIESTEGKGTCVRVRFPLAPKEPVLKNAGAGSARRRRPARKTGGRKSAPRKSTSRKSTPRKAASRKSAQSKSGARKPGSRRSESGAPAARKPTARKPAGTRAAGRKSTARKSAGDKTGWRSTAGKSTDARQAVRRPRGRKPSLRGSVSFIRKWRGNDREPK
jgi:PAS domain S-box-containing protein